VVGVVILPNFTVHTSNDAQRLRKLVRGDQPRADGSRALKVLALRDVELPMSNPIPDRPFVANRVAGDMPRGVYFCNPSAGAPMTTAILPW
jgi:hypothetical protein